MKFYELCNHTILNEMAAKRKEDIYRNTSITKKNITPDEIESFKKLGTKNGELYLLDRLDKEGRAAVVNEIINSLEASYETLEELQSALGTGLIDSFKERDMSVPKAALGWTVRILGKLLLKSDVINLSENPQASEDSAVQAKKDVKFNINYEELESSGIPAVDDSFVNVITAAVRKTFASYNEKNTQSISETKLQHDLTLSLDQEMEEADVEFREQTKSRIKQVAAGPTGIPMNAVIKTLIDSGAISDTSQAKSGKDDDDSISPVFDPEDDEDPSISPDLVRQYTGYEPDFGRDYEQEFGIKFS